MREIGVSEFKAKCLAILDEVERTGEEIVILKRGRPVARVIPPAIGQENYPGRSLKGTVKVLGDIVGPVIPAEDWEAEGGSKR